MFSNVALVGLDSFCPRLAMGECTGFLETVNLAVSGDDVAAFAIPA